MKTIICICVFLLGVLFACGDTSTAAPAEVCPAACGSLQGPAGVQGPAGPIGQTGPQGPTGLISKSHLYVVDGPDQSFNVNGAGPKAFSTQVDCKNAADTVINGGFDYQGDAWNITKCVPTNIADTSKVSGYHCDVTAGVNNGLGHAWVVCATP